MCPRTRRISSFRENFAMLTSRDDVFAIFLAEVVVQMAHLTVEEVLLSGSAVAKIAESAKSSPNGRAFETIINCSTQMHSARSTMRGDGVFLERVEMCCQNKMISLLVYVSETPKAS